MFDTKQNCKKCLAKLSYKKNKTGLCQKCWLASLFGENAPSWKGGRPKCVDCQKTIFYTSQRCKSCSSKQPNRIEKLISMSKNNSGENNYQWIKDRTRLAKKQERNDSSYKEWRMNVYRRDNFKCIINDRNCSGKIEAHHILGWSEFPELRYKLKNGITLCHAHHPKKRAEEKRLSPYFMELVSVLSE